MRGSEGRGGVLFSCRRFPMMSPRFKAKTHKQMKVRCEVAGLGSRASQPKFKNGPNAGLAVAMPRHEPARCSSCCSAPLFTSSLLLPSLFFFFLSSPSPPLLHCPAAGRMPGLQKNKHTVSVWLHPTFHRCQEDNSEGENSQHLQDQHGESGREERIIFTVTSPSVPGSLILLPPSLHTSLPMSHFHHLFFFCLTVFPSHPPFLHLLPWSHPTLSHSLWYFFFLHLYLTSRLPHSGCQAPFVLFEALNSSYFVLCISPEKVISLKLLHKFLRLVQLIGAETKSVLWFHAPWIGFK